ncbi:MAG: LamG domain-containing protein [Hyphomicrobiales bacterium]|nr:LamG domain-containing protein [Hyphomicrobiales bacterium]
MLKITGYADRVSVAAGQTIQFMVNCEYPHYRSELIRVVQGDTAPPAPPLQLEKIPSALDGDRIGRPQTIHAGSFGLVEGVDFGVEHGLTLQAMICPTTPLKGRQAIISKWDEASGRGCALVIDETGGLALELSEGTTTLRASTGKRLLKGYWYFVAASYDAESGAVSLFQEPMIEFPGMKDDGRAEAAFPAAIDWSSDAPIMFAGTWAGEDKGRKCAAALYNGKIDRPRVSGFPLAREQMEILRGDELAGKLTDSVVGAWDFSKDMEGLSIIDTSGHGSDGAVVNMPTRAVTGHNFTGEEMCWRHKPEHWSAIHFHDDDIYDAGWQVDFEFTVPADLRSGIYAARLWADEEEQFITFVVRPPRGTRNSKLLYLFPLATYMAYANEHFGTNDGLVELHLNRALVLHPHQVFLNEHREYGHSLYDLHSDGSGVYYSSRLRPILNLRPKLESVHGARPSNLWLFNGDTHLTSWLEHLDQDYDVVTDEDLHEEGLELLEGYQAIVTGTHPEYYTKQMWDAVSDYTRTGGRLMYLGGNGFYWRIAFHKSLPGIIETRRAEGGSRAWEPPTGEYYHSFTGEYGGMWRRQGPMSSNSLVGVGFIAQGFDESSYYRKTDDARDQRAAFIFEGIEDDILGDFGLIGGGAAGMEVDSHDPKIGSPPNSLVVARSEKHTEALVLVVEDMLFNFMGTTGNVCERIHSDIVFFETPHNGAVFSVGSIAYPSALPIEDFDNNISRMTANVLRRFLDPKPFQAKS